MKKFALALGSVAIFAVALAGGAKSGLDKGESVTPFHPNHFAGALANTTTCFPCTYQNRPQVQVWVNGDSLANVEKIAANLDSAMSKYKKQEFKALVVFVTNDKSVESTTKNLTKELSGKGFKNVSMAVIGSTNEAVKNYKINLDGDVKNTVFVYKNWKVADKMINVKADNAGLKSLSNAIESVIK